MVLLSIYIQHVIYSMVTSACNPSTAYGGPPSLCKGGLQIITFLAPL